VTREGDAELDYGPSDLFGLTASDGTTAGLELDGTQTSRLRATSRGVLRETLVSNDVVATFVVAGQRGDANTTEFSPWVAYSCSRTTLILSDNHQRMVFARQ
jgi:hypothetical protein